MCQTQDDQDKVYAQFTKSQSELCLIIKYVGAGVVLDCRPLQSLLDDADDDNVDSSNEQDDQSMKMFDDDDDVGEFAETTT